MVISMKKYLFLIFLFIIYLVLLTNKETKEVISYDDIENKSASYVKIDFIDGINSNDLKELFNEYDNDYYVYIINTGSEMINLSCDKIDVCIEDVFKIEDNLFNENYIATGFKVESIELIAYKDQIIPFLKKNNLSYRLS